MKPPSPRGLLDRLWSMFNLKMRVKLIIIFLVSKVIPLTLIAAIAWFEIVRLGGFLTDIAVTDSSLALNNIAIQNIERQTTDLARQIAGFLYERDSDILFLASAVPDERMYSQFLASKTGRLLDEGDWALDSAEQRWVQLDAPSAQAGAQSSNSENNDNGGFSARAPDSFSYIDVPLYDEITFIDLNGNEQIKIVAEGSTKVNYPLSPQKRNVSLRENTYVKAENYFSALSALQPGEIYVSDVIGAYVGSNYIGMYTPQNVADAAQQRGYAIEYSPQTQAYAGEENPLGQRFEGIVRWAAPVTDERGEIIGYVTLALNHEHISEFVDHVTPMDERYTALPSAYEGNYAFIWDYLCRSISHPRHHSIVGYDPETGEPAVPWLESSIYDRWLESGIESWSVYAPQVGIFDNQSRTKIPAPELTQLGLVGLDGRYLNNAPQCTGWMDLTENGGSGSFYILWSGIYKLTTAAAIPYYTGQYAPGEHNGFSQRGFGFVAIGAGLDDFVAPSVTIRDKLTQAVSATLSATVGKLTAITAVLLLLVVAVAVLTASFLTDNITRLIYGISRFRAGERQFRFRSPVKDEFGMLADAFDSMADNIDATEKNALFITGLDRKIIYANDIALKLCGKSRQEIAGRSYDEFSIYPASSKYSPLEALEAAREAEVFNPPGTSKYFKGSANYLLDDSGKKIGYHILTIDVTEMVRERMKIEEQRALLDTIFSASPDLIWYTGADGRFMAVNPRLASVAGRKISEIIGQTASEIFPADIAVIMNMNDREAMKSGAALYTEERVNFADGHEEILDCVRTPIFDAHGRAVGLLGFARNVTARVKSESDLRRAQLELERAVETANRANEHKGEFLARMSHEIRTPMNAILGMTNIALRKLNTEGGALPRDLRDDVLQIQVSSRHLLGLLNDILDLSKIEAGKIELDEQRLDLSRLVSDVVGIIKPRCDEKNITLGIFIPDVPPAAFYTDPLRLRQVLINLLGNAVKFTPDFGRVELRVELLENVNGCSLVAFSVRDTGIGIAESAFDSIFQSFEQGAGDISRKYGGAGLGLAISRRIVRLFGGDIAVKSELGAGSEFSFELWLRDAPGEHCKQDIPADVRGKYTGCRALLVDDVPVNRLIVASMLESSGIEIVEAEDGERAVDLFTGAPEGYFDIIFMDVHMPKLDGYQAAKAIRALERADAKHVPIVALTANAFREDIDKALSCGMNAHIAKPVEEYKLSEALRRFVPR